jgi:heat shock protein HslJ
MKPMHQTIAALLLAASVVTIAQTAELEGTDWQLGQVQTDDGLVDALGGARAMLRLEDGRLTGSAGCNRLMGGYERDGDKLRFSPNMASTMMACPPPLMAQEQAVTKALQAVRGFALEAERLVLADAGGEPLLTLTALVPPSLTGTEWRLTAYNNGKGGVVSVLEGADILLTLGDDGRFSGRACNTYRGGYSLDGASLQIQGPIASTKMACPGPEGTAAQESAYFAALERVAAYRLEADTLTLRDADGAALARFQAVETAEAVE